MKDCCTHTATDTQCKRKSDNKIFSLPRKFSRKRCRKAKGYTMKASCAPYKACEKQKGKGKGSLKRKCGVKSSTDRCVNSMKRSQRCYRSSQTKRCRKLKPKCSVRVSSGRCVNDTKGTRRCVRNRKTLRCRKKKIER